MDEFASDEIVPRAVGESVCSRLIIIGKTMPRKKYIGKQIKLTDVRFGKKGRVTYSKMSRTIPRMNDGLSPIR